MSLDERLCPCCGQKVKIIASTEEALEALEEIRGRADLLDAQKIYIGEPKQKGEDE